MDLRHSLDFLKRRWWLLLIMTTLAGVSAYFGAKQMTPIYRATATVLVNQSQAPGVIQYNDILTSERLTSTYAELVERRPVLAEVQRRLAHLDVSSLREKIDVSPIRDTQLLHISAEDADAQLAADIANTTAGAFIAQNSAQLGNQPGSISIAEEAETPVAPVKPNVKLITALAAILGLLVAGLIALMLEYLDDTVKSRHDVEELAGLTTLGAVSLSRTARRRGRRGSKAQAALAEPSSELIEDYRQLRTNIHFSLLRSGPKSILVTSSHASEGKTTTAANLALVLAQAGHSVILVDTDLRRPALHAYFGTANSFGLTGLLISETDRLEAALLGTAIPGLRLLPSGPLPPNPSELLMSVEVQRILQTIKSKAEYVILDSPPVLAVTDARLLAGQVDATVLVVERGKTRSEAFQRTCESLAQANARVIGIVLNKVRARRGGYYSYSAYRKVYRAPEPSSPGAKPDRAEERLTSGQVSEP